MINDLDINNKNVEFYWIQPSIDSIDMTFYTQKIIDDIYSVIDEKAEGNFNPNQKWFWTDEWQIAEQKVDEYIKKGDYEEFNTMEEFIRTLRE
jgi:pyocin large subunit-like protein